MNLYSDSELLQNALKNLREDKDRDRALNSIKSHVETALRELSLESFAKFESELYQEIFTFVNSEHLSEKQGGIRAIQELITSPSATAELKATQFSHVLSMALKNNTDFQLLELIANTLGHMAKHAPVSQVESVEAESIRSLEWLRGNIPHRRLAACAVLHQLAENAPTIFFVRCKEFFELVWGPLRDPKEAIRLCAARALSSSLSALEQRTYHLQWYCSVYDQVLVGFGLGTPEAVHGSLLVIPELLKHTGDFMLPRYKETCIAVLSLKEHRSRVVRASLINLIPRLSEYCQDAFVRSYLDDSIDILIRCMRTPELRGVALLSIGRLCRTMGVHLSYRVEELVAVVREALIGNSAKKLKDIPPEALKCVSDMVCGLGLSFHYRVLGLLDSMLQAGLTQELIEALAVIAENMPMHKEVVHQRLLGEIIKVLGGVTLATPPTTTAPPQKASSMWPFRSNKQLESSAPNAMDHSSRKKPTGRIRKSFAPVPLSPGVVVEGGSGNLQLSPTLVSWNSDPLSNWGTNVPLQEEATSKPRNYNPDLVLLAMRTLRMLSTPSRGILILVHRYIIPFLFANEEIIREEAAVTAAKLISPIAKSCCPRGPTADAVECILARLLEVVVVDTSVNVRMKVLKSIDNYFGRHLGQVHHLSSLMYLTSDENFEIRQVAMEIIGKLADKNPSIVLPTMRQSFKNLLKELQSGVDPRLKEETVLTISVFLRAFPLHRIVPPFVRTMIRALPLDCDVRLTTASMEALGELCTVMRQNILSHADELLPVIILNLQDRSSRKKQEIAVRTLGQLVNASGLVVTPYLQYPQLLPLTLDLLSKGDVNVPWTLRTEILRTIGLIGALDPRKYDHIVGQLAAIQAPPHQDSNEISITKICRQDIGELYLGEGSVRKFAEDAHQTFDLASTIQVSSWTRDRSGSLSKEKRDENKFAPSHNLHTEALVRAAIQINGVEADLHSKAALYELTTMHAQSSPSTAAAASADESKVTPQSEDYYPKTSIFFLMKILRDPTLSTHHPSATQAIMEIFKYLGMSSIQYVEEILPYFIQLLRKGSPGLRESLLFQISKLVSIIQWHISPYMSQLYELILEYWSDHSKQVIELMESLSKHAYEQIQSYVPQLLNLILPSLQIPKVMSQQQLQQSLSLSPNNNSSGNSSNLLETQISSTTRKLIKQLLRCLGRMRHLLTSYLELVFPTLCKLIHQLLGYPLATAQELLISSIKILYVLSTNTSLIDSPQIVSRVLHCVFEVISRANEDLLHLKENRYLYIYSLRFICSSACQLGKSFLVFDRVVCEHFSVAVGGLPDGSSSSATASAAVVNGIDVSTYHELIQDIKRGKPFSSRYSPDDDDDMEGLLTCEEMNLTPSSSTPMLLSGATLGGGGATGGGVIGERSNDYSNEKNKDHFKFIQDSTLYRNNSHSVLNLNLSSHKHLINQPQLQKAWDVSQRSTASDWNAWFARFSIQLLIESPSAALRSCSIVAQSHLPLAKDLFQASFVSCWLELSEHYQEYLIKSLHVAFQSMTIPDEILLLLLNLAEFMEHDVDALPIEPQILAELAEKSHAYAKALHYTELEFRTSPNHCYESLININKKLGLYDSAYGVLRMVQKRQEIAAAAAIGTGGGGEGGAPEIVVHESWLAQLGRWEDALEIYDKNLLIDPTNYESLIGKVKCLNAVGNWEGALELLSENLDHLESSNKSLSVKANIIGARAAWSLNRWELMDSYVQRLPPDNIDSTYMKAVLAVHNEDFDTSSVYIDRTRKHLDHSMTTLLAESYNRAYGSIVMAQQLSELEEIVEYKRLLKQTGVVKDLDRSVEDQEIESITQTNPTGPSNANSLYRMRNPQSLRSSTSMASMASAAHSTQEETTAAESAFSSSRHLMTAEAIQRKSFLIDKWRKRIRGCLSGGKAAISHWQRLLNLRRMIAGEREDVDTWLEFATLCRHSSNLPLAKRVLGLEMEDNPVEMSLENFVPSAFLPPGVPMSPFQSFASPLQAFIRPTGSYGSFGNLNVLDGNGVGELMSPRTSVDIHALTTDCRIEFEKLVLQWSLGKKVSSAQQLARLVQQLNSSMSTQAAELATIHLKCLLKLGSWKIRLLTPGVAVDQKTRAEIIQIYAQATNVNPKSYQAWHEWGLANYHAAQERGDRSGMGMFRSESAALLQRRLRRPSIPVEHIITYIVNSLKGLFRAISLGTSKSCARVMQDMLCILNFWFKYGEHPEICDVLKEGLELVPVDSWLGVLPQLIARIHHEGDRGRGLLHGLLENLGNRHAQALMYPLSVALQSPRMDRKVAAESLLSNMRQHSATLIEQSVLVSQELIRIAILWDEEWYSTLEDSSRLYFGDGNVQGMLDMLLPLHEKIALGPKTNSDTIFLQTYGNELNQAFHYLQQYQLIMRTNNRLIPTSGAQPNARAPGVPMSTEETVIAQAWELYIPIFKRIHPHLRQITSHNLINVSSLLHKAIDLDLAVPGTYTLHGEAVKIKSFRSNIGVIPSKQLPRKIRIVGHNGLEYVFLLKGHEDLRQDERAMQLFGLVNAMLQNDRRTEDSNLNIQRYAVVPLSPNVGLVGWVPRCDTLHDLIRSHRERKKIILDVEHRLMSQMASPKLYESLTSIQKLEVFEFALNSTSGEDLHKILWYNSTSCESWILRRAQYTKSLAVMSVVGYVLGLGDRHPSNLMLERQSCQILHIDFGDCFEVAMHRDKFPEKIPFRLTRMLVLAMEVSGIEGTFRVICERVMKVMRENRESLIAVLEAFVHDPLISWRLLNPNKDITIKGPESKQQRSSHKSPSNTGNESGEFGDHPPAPSHQTTPKSTRSTPPGGNKSTEHFTFTPTSLTASSTATPPSPQPHAVDPSMSVGPQPSSSPNLPIQRLTLFTDITIELPEEEGTGDEVTANSIERLATLGTAPETPYQPALDTDGASAGADLGGEVSVIVGSAGLDPSEEGYALGMEYDVVTTQYTSQQRDGGHPTAILTNNSGNSTAVGGGGGMSGSLMMVPPRKSSYRPNAHLELMNLSNSTLQRSSIDSLAFSSTKKYHMGSMAGSLFADGIATGNATLEGELTDKAVSVVHRVMDKLIGLDFENKTALEISEQIDRLIQQATSNENLSSCFSGWCAFW